MSDLLGYAGEIFAWLFNATDGAVLTVTTAIVKDPLLMIPVALLLVGLVIGVISRIISSVR